MENGQISEIHIVADSRRRPKWIVRDGVTTLFVRHGIRVDHQKISVAGSTPSELMRSSPDAVEPGWRLRVAAVHLVREEDMLRATVELREGERIVEASWEALATRANHLRVVAAATLQAVQKVTGGVLPLHLEEARRINLGGLPVALVHVVLVRSDGERSLVGSCPVVGDRLDAAAGAVLDAVNRILPPYRDREEEVEYEVQEETDV
jgi:hypothetical protein